ncbi:uncharacterized protein LOC124164581 isoform X2 [Ischnura elegans]|uniref:uncharacterized protein LOC124164581 isoform X2 n=1 Tax=Ischnura elegans TaxID=197161 RepID=UPI001ED8B8B4|nr:uncharacterized protein LOC124164581 isoform X2 [Ischnura elegans]
MERCWKIFGEIGTRSGEGSGWSGGYSFGFKSWLWWRFSMDYPFPDLVFFGGHFKYNALSDGWDVEPWSSSHLVIGGGGAGGGGAVCSDTNWSKGRRSCSGDASVPVRKMVRFRCHTCAEKLPTLNSLRTHLKSHSRPAPLTLPAALRCDQHLMPSATVVTSKYGRRRAVVSALVAIKPTRR